MNKKFVSKIKLGLGLCLLFPIGASAHLISITATQAFPATVATSSTTNALYQVTNLTSHVTLTIVDKSSFPNGLSISSSTCGNPIGPGQSCSITLKLVAPSTAQTISTSLKEWAKPSADGVQVPINVTVTGGSTPVTIPPVAVAVGKDNGLALGLIVASTDGGTTWGVKNFSGNLNERLGFVSCVNGTTQDLCVAAGPAIVPGTTIIPISTDGGNTWSLANTASIETFPVIVNGLSCTGSGTNVVCIITGQELVRNSPYLIRSTNLTHWQQTSITLDNAAFNGVSCTGSSSTAICVASGQDNTTGAPLLAVSNNGGSSWNTPSITGFSSGILNGVSCTGSGTSTICAVITNSSTTPIASSIDGGTTWNAKSVSGLTGTPSLSSISCTGNGSSAICVAAGSVTLIGLTKVFLIKSTDGANTWESVTLILPPLGQFNSVSCTSNGSTTLCAAVGKNTALNRGVIFTSSDGGTTWTLITSPSFANIVFSTASCNGTYCLAAGQANGSEAVLFQSLDSGQTWSQVTISGVTLGQYDGSITLSATTSSSSLSSMLEKSKIIKPEDQLKKLIK